jgi:polyferredoxin
MRPPFKVDVERDRKSLAREVEGGMIENVFRLQIMNASETPQRVHIQADGLPGLKVLTDPDLVVDAAQSRWVVVRLQVSIEKVSPGSHPIHFEIDGQDSTAVVIEKAVFIVPR